MPKRFFMPTVVIRLLTPPQQNLKMKLNGTKLPQNYHLSTPPALFRDWTGLKISRFAKRCVYRLSCSLNGMKLLLTARYVSSEPQLSHFFAT